MNFNIANLANLISGHKKENCVKQNQEYNLIYFYNRSKKKWEIDLLDEGMYVVDIFLVAKNELD